MPAKNPRLTITLEPSLAAQLRRLSELTGNSQSALISELLEGSGPTFQRLIQVLEAAQEIREESRGSIGADLKRAQEQLEGQLGFMLDTVDDATMPILEEVERVRRRAARAGLRSGPERAAKGDSTPLSNRGVRSTTPKTKKPSGSRG